MFTALTIFTSVPPHHFILLLHSGMVIHSSCIPAVLQLTAAVLQLTAAVFQLTAAVFCDPLECSCIPDECICISSKRRRISAGMQLPSAGMQLQSAGIQLLPLYHVSCCLSMRLLQVYTRTYDFVIIQAVWGVVGRNTSFHQDFFTSPA